MTSGDAAFDEGEIRARATAGVAVLGARSVLIYAAGVVVNLLLARLLTPREFGLFALGTAVVVVGAYVAAAGLLAALLRRPAAPDRRELEAVLALQLAATGALALAVLAVAIPFGEDGLVVAAMVASLPAAMFRVPQVIVLERELRYRVIATADVVEALVFYAWALGTVAAGFGVWGLATAVVARAVAGAVYLVARGPLGFVAPRWSWRRVRPLAGFGARVQLDQLLLVGREQGLNLVVVAVAGLPTLGVWNLTWRVLQVPSLLFQALGRVTFPAASRLLAARADVRPALERGLASLAAATALMAAGLAGLAPALPVLIGDEWSDVPAALTWASVALMIAAPLAVTAPPYLYAAGVPGRVAAGTFASAVVWFGVAAALLGELGAAGVAIAWVAAGSLNTALLWRWTVQRTGARLAARLGPPTAVGLAAIAAAWLVAALPGRELVGALAGIAAGEALALAGLALLAPRALRDLRVLGAQSLRTLRRP